jgi:NAD+ synthase
MKIPEGLKFEDYEPVKQSITQFIRKYIENAGVKGVVLGLSGGIDSALVAALACEALGPDSVLGMIMPVRLEKDAENASDAKALAKKLGMRHELFELEPVLKGYEGLYLDKINLGNLKARLRMVTLYAKANQEDLLVLGTGNKSEIMVGYFTKYGDGAADLLPIADLYKTNVIDLSKHMNLPEKIINKTPSAGLWPNQTDEDEMGITYRDLDIILYLLYERKVSLEKIISSGMAIEKVEKVRELLMKSEHKRNPIPRPVIR